MKHAWKITAILLLMFLVTQFIGLTVINSYSPIKKTIQTDTGEIENVTITPQLPYGMQPPEMEEKKDFRDVFVSIIISFIIAITLIFVLTKYKFKFIIKFWFFSVVAIALGITLNALLKSFSSYSSLASIIIAIPLAFYKIYKPNIYLHNLTELFIYPGIATVFVPILNITTIIILLIIISLYDMWAVWHSGIMQKMAKFQMEELNIFGGFFVPYLSKKLKDKLKKMKKTNLKKKVKVSLAILGGGDVIFPIITAGIFLRTFGLLPAILIILGAFLGLSLLFLMSEKKKFYPAMPFITAGMFLGMLVGLLI